MVDIIGDGETTRERGEKIVRRQLKENKGNMDYWSMSHKVSLMQEQLKKMLRKNKLLESLC